MAVFVIVLALVVGAAMLAAIAKLWFQDADPKAGGLHLS